MIEPSGEYNTLEKLASGGMGAVDTAFCVETDRIVAVRVLPHGLLTDDRSVTRLRREIEAVVQRKPASVVEAYGAREIDGTRLLEME